ncbi:neocarzinostatin apoprotein domain-containing protein [Actinocorallia longicatena]|uniref:Neocarzinostatin family protein n=1 Tax=Actinocorallia longicatena TaxID=111803 RepID=A0ABP6Q4P8_9ACTN
MKRLPLLLLPALIVTAVPAPALAAAPPVVKVSAVTGLTEGQKITVTGEGFQPGLKQIAVGMCREGYTNGPDDCDLDGGAAFVNADGNGRIRTVTLTVHAAFKGFDCRKRQCVIGVAPLPGTVPSAVEKANTAVVNVAFEGAEFQPATAAPSAAATTAASDPDGVGGPSWPLWLLTAGLLVIVTVVAARNQSLRRIT